jgi:protoporphyrinogen oxidase
LAENRRNSANSKLDRGDYGEALLVVALGSQALQLARRCPHPTLWREYLMNDHQVVTVDRACSHFVATPSASGHTVVIIGAGPAGLTAAYELVEHGYSPTVIEKSSYVGGIARTERYRGYRFDIGGHRFYTKVAEVERLWHTIMGADFRKVGRLSRIYYRSRFYKYPLDLLNTLGNLGPIESVRILFSYLKARIRPLPRETTLEEWVTNRFGDRLYKTFFKTYTEKVWGIPCHAIQADWAAQRIKGLSLLVAVSNALFGSKDVKTLIDEFHYPIYGPGMMWERFQTYVEARGSRVLTETDVIGLRHDGHRITSVTTRSANRVRELAADHVISSMPINELILQLDPPPPPAVLDAAHGLKYRAFILVGLIVDQPASFPDNWIYVHSPEVHVGRIQNFKNWSAEMVPDADKTSLGMEYFCNEDDALWTMSDDELIALARREVDHLGLAKAADVEDGVVIRQPKAYPVYDETYRAHLATIREYLAGFSNLQTIGRNGMHRYNNQDHSMLTGMLAARNLLGEQHDLWEVNTERSYYEDFTTGEQQRQPRAARPVKRVVPALRLVDDDDQLAERQLG